MTRIDNARIIRAARGTDISAKSWLTEAPLRMLMNNLDPAVAENPDELVVYGGIGRAARDWASFDAIVAIRGIWWSGRQLSIPAGCGIIEASRLVNEWRELRLKREAVKRFLDTP